MQPNLVNGWREVLARVFEGFDAELNVSPDWLINPDTNRRLKLDYLYRDVNLAVRFVGMEGQQKRRKSDEEVLADQDREDARDKVCREHGVVLVSIDPDDEPRNALRRLESGLSRAAAQLAQNGKVPHARKQALMPLLSQARRRTGEYTTKLTVPEKLGIYAEMWYDRQAALAAATPESARRSGPPPAFRQGMEVYHQRFGAGEITAIKPDGNDMSISVRFRDGSERMFLASLVADKLAPQ